MDLKDSLVAADVTWWGESCAHTRRGIGANMQVACGEFACVMYTCARMRVRYPLFRNDICNMMLALITPPYHPLLLIYRH